MHSNENPNRGKRKASPASARKLRTTLRGGRHGTTGCTVVRIDPARLARHASAFTAVDTAEREGLVVARNADRRTLRRLASERERQA